MNGKIQYYEDYFFLKVINCFNANAIKFQTEFFRKLDGSKLTKNEELSHS